MEPDQNHQPLLAWLLLFTGCVFVVPGFFDLFLGHRILDALPSFGAGSMMFALAAYLYLPPHRRRAKRGLRISGISLALAAGALSLYNMYIIPTDWAKPLAISLGLVMLTVLGIVLVFYHRRRRRSHRP